MPIIIPKSLPAHDILLGEKVFVMNEQRASAQDIRPIEIVIVNLMPTKVITETQLMRLLGNTPLQVNITLLKTKSYESKNTDREHLERFYKTFDEIKDRHFDGMIVTGAPVETLAFNDVKYWEELKTILEWAKSYVTSSIFICWGAQAALKYYYGIEKKPLKEKMFGIFKSTVTAEHEPLLKGVDDIFFVPMSRHTTVSDAALKKHPALQILASTTQGACIVKSVDNKNFFFFGHSEYDRDTLKKEYIRDVEKGLPIKPPKNYFAGGSLDKITVNWRATAHIMFTNWLNYYVYQITPYEFAT